MSEQDCSSALPVVMVEKPKPTIALDFDGVLHHYDGWHGPDHFNQPIPGAKDFLDEASKRFRLVIFTTRAEGGVWDWLRKHNMEGCIAAVTNIKPLAVAYVDDRAVRFEGDWNRLFIDIERQPWWEKL